MRLLALLAASVALFAASHTHAAIILGQVDTFQNGTTMAWEEGGISPNPPTNVPNGGPGGAGDAYLQDVSTGDSGAGSRLVMFNLAQWSGNYSAAGVNRITMQMASFGGATLHMRIALRSLNSTTFGSTAAFELPPDGIWRTVTFDLTTSALTNINGGTEPLSGVLTHVAELRVLSALAAPSFIGDPIAATLGVDNITATSIAAPTIAAAVSRKNHNGTAFDVNLPLTGTAGVECRLGGATNDYSIVVTFSTSVSVMGSPQAEVIAGAGAIGNGGVSNGGAVTGAGNAVTIPLTGVTSQQTIQVRLNSVNGSNFIIPMGVLVGDATADGSVNSADVTLTRSRSGQASDATNFREDYNTDGSINAADATLVRARSGNFIP